MNPGVHLVTIVKVRKNSGWRRLRPLHVINDNSYCNGLKTDYLWKEILTKDKLTRIIESYAQVVTEVDEETKKKTVKQIFPRYHQLDVVEKLIADVEANGVGNRYLIQHSAGSGKSNSIAWLAYRLMELEKDAHPIFNSILVVTDRRILDKQIRDNIKQFAQVGNVVAWAEHSGDLRNGSLWKCIRTSRNLGL